MSLSFGNVCFVWKYRKCKKKDLKGTKMTNKSFKKEMPTIQGKEKVINKF